MTTITTEVEVPDQGQSLADFIKEFEGADRSDLPVASGRPTVANHPDWLAAHAAHGVVAAERQALQAELSEIDETLAERGTSLRDRGMAALAAAHTGNAVATVEVDVVALQARRKKVADRIAVLQAAEAHSTARMHHYTPEAPPLRMEISLDVCQQNAKEYAALMTKVLAMRITAPSE